MKKPAKDRMAGPKAKLHNRSRAYRGKHHVMLPAAASPRVEQEKEAIVAKVCYR